MLVSPESPVARTGGGSISLAANGVPSAGCISMYSPCGLRTRLRVRSTSCAVWIVAVLSGMSARLQQLAHRLLVARLRAPDVRLQVLDLVQPPVPHPALAVVEPDAAAHLQAAVRALSDAVLRPVHRPEQPLPVAAEDRQAEPQARPDAVRAPQRAAVVARLPPAHRGDLAVLRERQPTPLHDQSLQPPDHDPAPSIPKS